MACPLYAACSSVQEAEYAGIFVVAAKIVAGKRQVLADLGYLQPPLSLTVTMKQLST
jgi:hypothetical protein